MIFKPSRNQEKHPTHYHSGDIDRTLKALQETPNAKTKAAAEYALELYRGSVDAAVQVGADRGHLNRWNTADSAQAILDLHSQISVSRAEDLAARIELSQGGLRHALGRLAGTQEVMPEATKELLEEVNHGLMRLAELDAIVGGLTDSDRLELGQTLVDAEQFAGAARGLLSSNGATYNEKMLNEQEAALNDFREHIAETRLLPSSELSTMRELSAAVALADGLTLGGEPLAELPHQENQLTSMKIGAQERANASAIELADALVERVEGLTVDTAYSQRGPDGQKISLFPAARYLVDEMEAFAQVIADAPHVLAPGMASHLAQRLERLKAVDWPEVVYDPADVPAW